MITKKHRDELKSFDAPHQPYSQAVRVDLLLQELVDSNGGSECVPVLVRGKLQRDHKITIVAIVTTKVTIVGLVTKRSQNKNSVNSNNNSNNSFRGF